MHAAARARSRLRQSLPAVLGVVLAATTVVGAPVARVIPATEARAAGTFADPFFREFTVFSGLTKPISVRFASDGRAFVAEKGGVVKAFDSVADTTPTTVIDIRTDVNSYWDRGLLGIAIDPDFLAAQDPRPYLYLYYVYDAKLGATAPRWNDTCPSSPGGTTDGCVVSSRLDRIEIDSSDNSMVPGSQTTLVADWCQQYPSHSGGGLAFGPDKQLYLSAGDGASFTFTDYGQRGGTMPNYLDPVTPVNPCGDPVTVTSPAGEKPVVETATAEGGSLRAQDLRTMTDPVGLDGTVIRVDPVTGGPSATNPLLAETDPMARYIVAHGFRNPFRLVFRPGTSDLFLGDVGNQTWEEIERVTLPTAPRTPTTMPNYGWPCYEGPGKSSWQGFGINLCTNLYAAGASAVSAPLYAYSHVDTLSPTGPCFAPDANGKMGSAVTGLAFYSGPTGNTVSYPGQYDGALFFVDYTRNCLAAMLAGAGGVPDPTQVVQVASGLGHPVDLVTGPSGDLFYVDLDGGRVVQVRYLEAPVARATVTPGQALAPTTFHLDGSTSTDPNGLPLSWWRWDLDNDGVYDVTNPTPLYNWDVTDPGKYPVTLQVESSSGLTDTATVLVDATNDAPVPSIDTPADTLTWAVGDEITFSGSATDSEDNPFPDAGLDWDVVMMHCPADCHEHIVESMHGVSSGSFTAPDHEYPSHIELRLTATDRHGASTRTSIELQPKTATLTVGSSPSGIPITVGDAVDATPIVAMVIKGGTTSISAPLIATVSGARYRFTAWDDASTERVRDITAPDDVSITATYVPDAPDSCATATTSSTTGSWLKDRASGNGDADWYRFSLSSRRRVIVTLGNLPVDARLDLYSSCSTLIASSNAGGTRYEELTRVLAAGTYRVRVSIPSGASDPSQYAIRFRPMSSGLVVKSARVTSGAGGGGPVRIIGEVLNNTGTTRGMVTVKATFRNGAGATVATLTGSGFARRLADGDVTPFGFAGTVPAYASVSYTVTAGSPGAARSLTASSIATTVNGDGTVTETGSVKNTGTTTLTGVGVARTWYGKLGEVLDRGVATASPSTLGPGKSGAFTVLRPVLPTAQGARTQLRAS